MNRDQAERWVVISAALVAAIYAYRRVVEPASTGKTTVKNVIGQGSPPPLGTFVTAWGFTYTVVSILATASPALGGAFALLVASADFLANAPAIFTDVGKHTSGSSSTASALGPVGGGDFATTPVTVGPVGGGDFGPVPLPHPPVLTGPVGATPGGGGRYQGIG